MLKIDQKKVYKIDDTDLTIHAVVALLSSNNKHIEYRNVRPLWDKDTGVFPRRMRSSMLVVDIKKFLLWAFENKKTLNKAAVELFRIDEIADKVTSD